MLHRSSIVDTNVRWNPPDRILGRHEKRIDHISFTQKPFKDSIQLFNSIQVERRHDAGERTQQKKKSTHETENK